MRNALLLAVMFSAGTLASCTVGEVGPLEPGNSDAGGGGGGNPADAAPAGTPDAPGGGGTARLQITATSTPSGGQYAPAHVVAVWVESNGAIVRTIQRWSGARTRHLVAWNLMAGAGDTDAVSGATRNNHNTPLTITWDLRDRAGQIVPDGTYTVRMESTDRNSNTAAQNNQGTFTFVKSGTAQMQTMLTNGGFSTVSLNFTP